MNMEHKTAMWEIEQADAVIVGRFVGKEALSAVGGGTGTLIQLLVGFFVGLSSGATVIISQYYGA